MAAIQRDLKNTGIILCLLLTCYLLLAYTRPSAPDGNDLNYQESLQYDVLGRPRCQTTALQDANQFWDYFRNIEYKCQDLRGLGERQHNKDGLKYVCFDPAFEIQRDNCTVLSFGINNEWEFEDDIARIGCKVYAFDPTMHQVDHRRSQNVFFYNLGLGEGRGLRKIGMNADIDYFQVERYEAILKRLGLEDAPIHYVKMDIELSELEFLRDALRNSPHLLKNVRQLAMEIHHGMHGEGVHGEIPVAGELSPTSTFPLFWQHFQELWCLGFRVLHTRQNLPWHEILWGRPHL